MVCGVCLKCLEDKTCMERLLYKKYIEVELRKLLRDYNYYSPYCLYMEADYFDCSTEWQYYNC